MTRLLSAIKLFLSYLFILKGLNKDQNSTERFIRSVLTVLSSFWSDLSMWGHLFIVLSLSGLFGFLCLFYYNSSNVFCSDTAQFVCWLIISSGSQLRKSIKISEQNTPTLTLLNKINNEEEKLEKYPTA